MASKRFLMVPEDSSAARMPRPGATMALATLLSSARFMVSSISLAGRGGPGWRQFLTGWRALRLLCGRGVREELGVKLAAGVALGHGRGGQHLDLGGLTR